MGDIELSEQVKGPWRHIQDWDVELLGEEILDPTAQERWALALAIAGGLPYMWRTLARPVSDILYGLMELKAGDRVLVIGEGVEPAGWHKDIAGIVGDPDLVDVVEIIREGREHVLKDLRGRNGIRGCWQWNYTKDLADEHYDVVGVLQSTQHCDDWKETGPELLRVMKPGRRIVFAEITWGPNFAMRANADLHLQQWHDKLNLPEGIPYYSGPDLMELFAAEALEDPQTIEWKGVEVLWGRKPGLRA